jgi:hypothetical protein
MIIRMRVESGGAGSSRRQASMKTLRIQIPSTNARMARLTVTSIVALTIAS